ncbi:glycosyltransferase family 2 protein [Megalodesulfovibrio gigas]|uniref:Putative glycosyl transferase family protein n=1 Tax=Megalodesulfovibrio gigas (strain ATCC 19364 / DSM 1382 / NCIMB 9332 / VKM B-1759) TaxID=1121448 RepID=T2GCL7_MEGG1|nr:glycosyltransferase [Megalodesulfovibrio gigas]AGW13871.1 putative glycosyl transferase family protein [Megalodesulfovibrio gigas DSM 1382 = ATCC 19364]
MKTAVIVPMKNELRGLATLLTTLYAQLSPGDELVVVDAGSDDGTWEFVTCFAATHPQLKPLRVPGAYPGAARNAGIRATDAPIIAQVDGGNLPNAIWLDTIRAPILDGSAEYVTGNSKIMPIWTTVLGRRIDLGSIYGAVSLRGRWIRRAPPPDLPLEQTSFKENAAGGDSVCYRRELWEKAGGFAEWLRFGEDPLFVNKLDKLQPRYTFAEDAVVFWQLGPGLWDILVRRCRSQRRGLRTRAMIAKRWRQVVQYIGLGSLLAASLVVPALQPWALGIWGVAAAVQCVKSFKTWCTRAHPDIDQADRIAQRVAGIVLIPVLDILGVLARIVGTAQALFQLSENEADWGDRVTEYLNS